MKKIFIISLLFFSGLVSFAQDNDKAAKIRDRMNEYIQNRLGLSKDEAEKFTPVFLRYFKEFNQTHRENKADPLILKQRIIELRIHYRDEFRQVMNEQKANKIFVYEDEFRRETIKILENQKNACRNVQPAGSVPICNKIIFLSLFSYIFELGVFHRLATAGSFQSGPSFFNSKFPNWICYIVIKKKCPMFPLPLIPPLSP